MNNGLKKKLCGVTLVCCLVLGAVYAADLFLNTDAATGFLVRGSAVTRCVLALPVLALCFLLWVYVPKAQSCGRVSRAGVWQNEVWLYLPAAAACAVYAFRLTGALRAGQVVVESENHPEAFEGINAIFRAVDMVSVAGFLLLALWCVLRFTACRTGRAMADGTRWLGILGSMGIYLYVIVSLASQSSGIHRLSSVVSVLAPLAVLRFFAALLRAVYLPEESGAAPALVCEGMLAFFFGTCLTLPQALWQWVHGDFSSMAAEMSVLEMALGAMGLVCAKRMAAQDAPGGGFGEKFQKKRKKSAPL